MRTAAGKEALQGGPTASPQRAEREYRGRRTGYATALVRLSLDHDQPPAPVNARHRDAFNTMAAPLDCAPELPRLPAVPLEVRGRKGDDRDLASTNRAWAFGVRAGAFVRWSEQRTLKGRDVDLLAGFVTVPPGKNGRSRQVPMNSVVRAVLPDLATQRARTDDPHELVCACSYREPDKFFPAAVERARQALEAEGQPTGHLEAYTWRGNRHTFASRLVMAGVDLRTVQQLGGWQSLAMVQRYAHLAPDHLRAAVERLVRASDRVELGQD